MTTISSVQHVTAAIGRLCGQFADKPNIVAWLSAMAGPAQPIDDALIAILVNRAIGTAFGAQLDLLGKLLGLPRNGLADPDYQRMLFAIVAAENSNGNTENLISVASLLLNNQTAQIVVDNQGRAATVVRILNITVTDALANIMIDFLHKAAAAGVRVILETQYVTDPSAWAFALAAFSTAPLSIGATTILVDSTAGFAPGGGGVTLDFGVPGAFETVSYIGITPTSFTGVTPLVHNHVSGCCVQQASGIGLGLGMGDTNDASIGGAFESARDSHFTRLLAADEDFWATKPSPVQATNYQPLPFKGRDGNFKE